MRALEQRVERVAVEALVLDEVGGDPAERLHVHQQGPARLGVGLVEDRRGSRAWRPAWTSDGSEPLGRTTRNDSGPRPEMPRVRGLGIAAHAPLGDHGRRDLVGLVEVVRGAAGDLVEQHLLGRAAAHQGDEARPQVGLGREVVVLLAAHGDAERLAVGEDADLLDPALVAVDLAAIAWPTSWAAMIDRSRSSIDRRRDVPTATLSQPPWRSSAGDLGAAAAGRQDRGLVEQVGELAPAEAVGLARDVLEVDRGSAIGLLRAWTARISLAAVDVRQPDVDLAVEAARAEDGRVERVEAVGRGDDDDVIGRPEAVELDEQLVERLLALLVAVRAAAGLADRVELVEEDDAAAELAGLGEQLADALGADADVLLDELRAGRVVERDAGLGRDRAGEHRLAGARRAVQHDPARDPGAELVEALGRLQELDRLGQLELGLVTRRRRRRGAPTAWLLGGRGRALVVALARDHRDLEAALTLARPAPAGARAGR